MKKLLLILLLTILLNPINSNAANYSLNELIPKNIETTIVTDNFSYKDFYYNNGAITFKGIKNLTNDEKPLSFSIALFNEEKKNIGTIYYCSKNEENPLLGINTLIAKEEKSFIIYVHKYTKDINEISYISLIGDNHTCRGESNDDYKGQTIEDITRNKNDRLDQKASLFVQIVGYGILLLVCYLLYLFLFTNRFRNVDSKDIRRSYKDPGPKKEEEKKEEKIKNDKDIEILEQEEKENKNKDNTDLHNFYK
ncbi:MAG: hypothetical protein IJ842_02510 [Bacilli bacterium]|nr:hypothetical protein [Bacilli bacterium]